MVVATLDEIKMFAVGTSAISNNLTCYQCTRHDLQNCDIRDLKACGSPFDRCAMHVSKNAQEGLVVKRECGLAPCSFDDELMASGLGMQCNPNSDSYSCTYCCKESGCNKSASRANNISTFLLIFCLVLVCLLNVARDFVSPYVPGEKIDFKL
ncbi:hypothetical protein YQE_001000, partial [Dendroctonus ponderosae]